MLSLSPTSTLSPAPAIWVCQRYPEALGEVAIPAGGAGDGWGLSYKTQLPAQGPPLHCLALDVLEPAHLYICIVSMN